MAEKYNRLTIIRRVDDYISPSGRKDARVLCKCDCGNEKIVRLCHVKSGYTKSCGCLHIEKCIINQKKTIKLGKDNSSYKHGMTKTRFYKIWKGMIKRCNNINEPFYKNYGGRGISVCSRWYKFENFRDDMLPSYRNNLSIDRIDNNGNYCKENCRWATREIQNSNKRNNLIVIYKDEPVKLLDISKAVNLSVKTIAERIYKLGWSVEKAIETPLLNNKTRLLYNYK